MSVCEKLSSLFNTRRVFVVCFFFCFRVWSVFVVSLFSFRVWSVSVVFFFLFQGLYDQAYEDCEKALQLNEGNYKALYRKAKSLKEMGRHQEAYEAVAKCSLAVPQVNTLYFLYDLFSDTYHSFITETRKLNLVPVQNQSEMFKSMFIIFILFS